MDTDPGNETISQRLAELAALLELAEATPFSVRAYRRAAALIGSTELPVARLVREGRARELSGIGPGIERRLAELVETGRIAELEDLRATLAPELAALGQLLGFGAKVGARIGATLGIRTEAELREAARTGRLREVPGVGPKVEAKIRAALDRGRVAPPARALTIGHARDITGRIAGALGGVVAGDPRRWLDASTRLAVVVSAEDPEPVRRRFAELPEIVTLLDDGMGVTPEGVPVELVIAPPASFGTALVRATGPAAYVEALEPLPDAPDEAAVYERLGAELLPPELRGMPLPPGSGPGDLVTLDRIRGDLHAHTTWSDGRASVLEMATAARARGYEYLAICDHTPAVGVVPGLDADALRRQAVEIAAANDELAPFRVLRGVECDIRRDGALDLPDDVLGELDWVQLSLHAGQRAARAELTARVTEAMRHPAVRCLSHPTGRMIGRRPENALDLARTIEVALETGVALEVNGLPDRLDLAAEHVRVAIEAGVTIVCSTDAHSVQGLANMELSVMTARRGGAAAADVLNTQPLHRIVSEARA